MATIQNIGGIVNTGSVNGNIGNVYYTQSQSDEKINWNRLASEVALLNEEKLPPSAREFAVAMKDACERKDASKVRSVCAKLGKFVLAFVESLGLELIASLITASIMG